MLLELLTPSALTQRLLDVLLQLLTLSSLYKFLVQSALLHAEFLGRSLCHGRKRPQHRQRPRVNAALR